MIKILKRGVFAIILVLLSGFVYAQTSLKGDFNNDGKVDFDDFFLFADAFGKCNSAEKICDVKFDLDLNFNIDVEDFFIFADEFGKKVERKNTLCAPLLSNGDPKDKVDVVILGDGYSPQQMDLFKRDAEAFMNNILAFEPFKSYKDVFNFYRIDQVNDFGCGCKTNGRVGCCDNTKIESVASKCPYDQALVSINVDFVLGSAFKNLATDKKGYAMMTRDAPKRNTVVHEFGHSFGALTDEYYRPMEVNFAPGQSEYGLNCDIADVGNACRRWCTQTYSKDELASMNCEAATDEACISKFEKGVPCRIVDRANWNLEKNLCVNIISLCTKITEKSKCIGATTYGICQWGDSKDLLLQTNCIPVMEDKLDKVNFGKACKEGYGCYRGCKFGNWYRSSIRGTIMGGEGAVEGATPVFSPVAYDVLVDELNKYNQTKPAIEPATNNPKQDLCKEVFPGFNGDVNERVNLVFMSFNYENIDKFLEKVKPLVNPEDEKNSFFAFEPVKSNKNKFNLWYVDKLGQITPSSTLVGGLPIQDPLFYSNGEWKNFIKECSNIPAKVKVGVVMLNGQFFVQIYGSANPDQEGFTGNLIFPNKVDTFTVQGFQHDFTHAYAKLRDEYAFSSDAFIELPPVFILQNCDIANSNTACTKWCKDVPAISVESIKSINCANLDIANCVKQRENGPCYLLPNDGPLGKANTCINLVNFCASRLTEASCKDTKNNFIWFSLCSWVREGKKHPYYGASCIPFSDSANIGTQCIEGTGCYNGCNGNAGFFRSERNGLLRELGRPLGVYNEKLFCDKIKVDTGSVGGRCNELFELFK